MKKIGFIGMGNMAQALAEGFISSQLVKKNQLYAFAPNQEKLLKNAERVGFTPASSLKELTSEKNAIDTFILACKPYQINDVLADCGANLASREVNLVSVAAGWGFCELDEAFKKIDAGYKTKIQAVMPNTPAMVKEGVFLFEEKNSLLPAEHDAVLKLFSSLGIVCTLPSSLMAIGGAVSGCGPAFVDLFIESYADAAVKYGLPRETAYRLVSQTVLGSAALCLKTGTHPAVLKDAVCSPNGTTICGVAALEKEGFRNACISSIDAIMLKKRSS